MTPTLPAAPIAIVIPTYNRAETIARAVQSVLAAPVAGLELVVADDASNDKTSAVLAEFADVRLKVLFAGQHRNGNVARNAGIAATTAPVVAFLDSDDEFLGGRIERLVDYFAANPSVEGVLDGFVVVDGAKRQTIRHREQVPTSAAWSELLLAHALPLTCSAIAVRRQALTAVGGFDESLGRHQDRDLLMRLAARCRVAVGAGVDLVKYQRGDSFSRNARDYVAGLDAFAIRHPALLDAEHRDVLAYLVARGILKPWFAGRFGAAIKEGWALTEAKNIPFGFLGAVSRYTRGKAIRRRIEREFAGG